MRCYLALSLTLFAALPAARADDPQRPPPLTFDKPVDYAGWYNKLVLKPDERNAYDVYLKLIPNQDTRSGFFPPWGPSESQMEALFMHPRVWQEGDYFELCDYLRSHCDPQLKTLKQALQRRYCWVMPREGGTLLEAKLPFLMTVRDLSRALVARSWLSQPKQADVMLDAWKDVLRITIHVQQHPFLISQFVGYVNQALIFEKAAPQALRERVFTGEDVERALKLLLKYKGSHRHLKTTVQVEWAGALDGLQYVFPGGKRDEARWNESVEPLREVFGEFLNVVAPMNPHKSLKLFEDYYTALAKEIEGPCSIETQRRIEALHKGPLMRNAGAALVVDAMFGFSTAYMASLRQEASRRGTLLAYALHAHKHKHRAWPKSLDELKLKGLDELRIDPYSGHDFVYRLKEDGPLLYSVGVDGDSDGRHNPDFHLKTAGGGDYVYWP